MYLAPLNYDRFFKKVFSDTVIAKNFLEDFLGIKIETIKRLTKKNKITDDAAFVEFDFRCKVNDHYIIIDMQQWYKASVIKRFYLYHSLNSALQLESLPKRELPVISGRKFDTRNYSDLLPTITLIWMSDDCLGFEEDFISYALYPEQTADFFQNDALWQSNDIEKMSIERDKILTLLHNNTKELGFLPQNRMIYSFQKNIVKNKKMTKYFRWFELAEKTRNKENTEQDFVTFKNDKTLMAVMERIKVSKFEDEELSAFEALERELALSALWRMDARDDIKIELRDEMRQEVRSEVKEEVRSEVKEEVRSEVKEEVRSEVKEEVRSEVKEEIRSETVVEIVITAFQNGVDKNIIAVITHLSVEKIDEIVNQYKKNT